MPEPTCQELQPPVTQYVYECIDGKLYRKPQTLWRCTLGENYWLQWRDQGDWELTAETC